MTVVVPSSIRVLMPNGQVAEMKLETYLAGAVVREMSADAPLEALKAQAVASRTYAASARRHPEVGADVCTTTHCQEWKRVTPIVAPEVFRAVGETWGMVAIHNGKMIDAFFFEHCDGHTRSAEDVLMPPVPYLQGVDCACGFVAMKGHGVGLCQRGAIVMARRGASFEQILSHYYRGVVVIRTDPGHAEQPVSRPAVRIHSHPPEPKTAGRKKKTPAPPPHKPPPVKPKPASTPRAAPPQTPVTEEPPAAPPPQLPVRHEPTPAPSEPVAPEPLAPVPVESEAAIPEPEPEPAVPVVPTPLPTLAEEPAPIEPTPVLPSAEEPAPVEPTPLTPFAEVPAPGPTAQAAAPTPLQAETAVEPDATPDVEPRVLSTLEAWVNPAPPDIQASDLEPATPPRAEAEPVAPAAPPADEITSAAPAEPALEPAPVFPCVSESELPALHEEVEFTSRRVHVDHLPGPRMIAGSLGTPGVVVSVEDEHGTKTLIFSGSAPHYGEGGFETVIDEDGCYTVFIDGERILVEVCGNTVFIHAHG